MKSLDRINNFIIEHASGRTVLALMVVTIVSFYLMAGVITPAFQEATNGLRPFDLNFGISAEMIYRDLPSYTDRSRTLYLCIKGEESISISIEYRDDVIGV